MTTPRQVNYGMEQFGDLVDLSAPYPLSFVEQFALTETTVEISTSCYAGALMLQALGLGGWMYDGLNAFSVLGASGDPAVPGLGFHSFTIEGQPVDIGRIDRTAVIVVEGEKDDISAPGQCKAALDLLTGLPEEMKGYYLEPNAGHYGIFAGSSWRKNIRPYVLDFLDRAGKSQDAEPKLAGRRKASVVSSSAGSGAMPDSVPV